MASVAEEALPGALQGDPNAARRLVEALAPVVKGRVARALLNRRSLSAGRDIQQEVEDMTQEVFAALFARGAKALRAWEPARGASLLNFVGLIAEREVASIMRSGKRSPWTEDPTMDDELVDSAGHAPAVDAQVASREELQRILDEVRRRLSPKGLHLFRLLLVEQRSVKEVAEETQMTTDALYAWRSRLMKLVRSIRAEMSEERPAKRSSGGGGS